MLGLPATVKDPALAATGGRATSATLVPTLAELGAKKASRLASSFTLCLRAAECHNKKRKTASSGYTHPSVPKNRQNRNILKQRVDCCSTPIRKKGPKTGGF